jgi:ATP-binding cassette subfamily F protein 3
VGHGVTLHYFAQHQAEILNPEHSILESLAEVALQAEMNYLRGIAGTFLFTGQDQKKPIKALSGGERNRVALARMLVEPANTLLLDEPTNHLDPISVDILTDALTDFPGTLVFISHDPTFLSRVSTRIVEIDEGKARDYYGDYEYYLWKRAQEWEALQKEEAQAESHEPKLKKAKKERAVAPPVEASTSSNKNHRRELTKSITRLEKQVGRAEEAVTQLEGKINVRGTELADPALYQEFTKWNTLHQEQEEWKQELDVLTNRWSKLSQELEGLKQELTPSPS